MCDAAVATGAHSASGRALFAKNSDRKEGECQPFVQHPAAFHPRGATVGCTHIAIPEVAETYGVMGHSPWWVWGFEHGVNEHGVAIGNQTVFSREDVELEPGLIGMDLVRLGLERGRTAREAVEVIATLLEAHGQGGPALAPDGAGYHNSFTLADPSEVWLLETSGRRWAAKRADAGALTNHMTLGVDWEIGSRDLETFARAQGWWRDDGRVDVAAAYRNEFVPGRISEGRLRRSCELLAAEDHHDVASLRRLLRDHGEGGVAPPEGATPDDERYFTLCMHSEPIGTTTASMIAELPRDRSVARPVQVGFGTPCTGIFLPVYLDAVLPPELARGGELPSETSAWWVFERLRRAASSDFARHTPQLRKSWAPLEERIEHERRRVEASVAASTSPEAAEALLGDFMQRTVDGALALARTLTQQIAD
jgi:secernin